MLKVRTWPLMKAAALLLIFMLLFRGASEVFRTKEFAFSVGPIYSLPRDSVDVLFLGSSHMNTVISPMDIWEDYGITSFNAAIGDQTIPASYFELRELLKIQRPKVVVLETYHIFQPEMMTDSGEERLHWLVDNIPMSRDVSEAIQTLIREDSDKTEYYLNFYAFHNRWQELTAVDFMPVENNNMGADMALYHVWSEVETPKIIPREETAEPPAIPVEYLYKIIDLCRDNGISLLLMASPCCGSEDLQKQLNYVGRIAEEEQIPYLNFFYLLDEIGFDFSQDMAEESHMNYGGVQKVTSFVGEYLKENYPLEDRRSEPETSALWDSAYKRYSKVRSNLLLKRAASIEDCMSLVREHDYILALYAYNDPSLSTTRFYEVLTAYGVEPWLPNDANYYCALMRQGKIVEDVYGREKISQKYMLEDVQFSFGEEDKRQNPIAIQVGRIEYARGTQGVNLVIYDPMTKTVVDSININLENMGFVR